MDPTVSAEEFKKFLSYFGPFKDETGRCILKNSILEIALLPYFFGFLSNESLNILLLPKSYYVRCGSTEGSFTLVFSTVKNQAHKLLISRISNTKFLCSYDGQSFVDISLDGIIEQMSPIFDLKYPCESPLTKSSSTNQYIK